MGLREATSQYSIAMESSPEMQDSQYRDVCESNTGPLQTSENSSSCARVNSDRQLNADDSPTTPVVETDCTHSSLAAELQVESESVKTPHNEFDSQDAYFDDEPKLKAHLSDKIDINFNTTTDTRKPAMGSNNHYLMQDSSPDEGAAKCPKSPAKSSSRRVKRHSSSESNKGNT